MNALQEVITGIAWRAWQPDVSWLTVWACCREWRTSFVAVRERLRAFRLFMPVLTEWKRCSPLLLSPVRRRWSSTEPRIAGGWRHIGISPGSGINSGGPYWGARLDAPNANRLEFRSVTNR